MMELNEKLRQIVASVFEVEASSISLDDTPTTIAKWDSVNHLNLILALEGEFGLRFHPGEFADLMSVAAVQAKLVDAGVA